MALFRVIDKNTRTQGHPSLKDTKNPFPSQYMAIWHLKIYKHTLIRN